MNSARTVGSGQPRWSATATLTPLSTQRRGRASGVRASADRPAAAGSAAGGGRVELGVMATIQADSTAPRSAERRKPGSAQGVTPYRRRCTPARIDI